MSAAPARPLGEETLDDGAEAARRRDQASALARPVHPCGAALIGRLGVEAAAHALGASPSLVSRLVQGPPTRRRRLAALLCERLGLALEEADAVLAQLPARPVALAEAAFRFAVTLEIAGAPRVLGRDAYERLNARFGADAVAFALARRGLVRAVPDAGRGEAEAEAVVARAPDLLVDTLAASDHPLAGPVAAILARPQPLRGVLADAFVRDPGRMAVALDAIETARVRDEQLVLRAASRPVDPAPPVESETVAFAAEPQAALREAASG